MVLELAQGEHHDLVLEISDRELPAEPVQAALAWSATENAWHSAVPRFDNTISADDCRQSYAVLRGMTEAGGAMVAASTMGLPERAGKEKELRLPLCVDPGPVLCRPGGGRLRTFPLLDDAVGFVAARLLDDGRHCARPTRSTAARCRMNATSGLPGYPGGPAAGNWVKRPVSARYLR